MSAQAPLTKAIVDKALGNIVKYTALNEHTLALKELCDLMGYAADSEALAILHHRHKETGQMPLELP